MTQEVDEEELEDDSTEKVRSFTSAVKQSTDQIDQENETVDPDNDQSDPSTEDEAEDDTVTEDRAKGIDRNKTKLKVIPKSEEKLDDKTLDQFAPKLAETLQTVQGGANISAQEMQTILKTSPNALKLMRKVADTHAFNMETYGSASAIEINGKRYKRQNITTKVWREAKKTEAGSELETDPVKKVDKEIDTFNERALLYWGIPKAVAEQMNFTYLKTLVTAVEYSILQGFR